MNMPLAEKIRLTQKAELHAHIEGTMEQEMLVSFSARDDIAVPYTTAAVTSSADQLASLTDLPSVYCAGLYILVTEQNFYDLTSAYLSKAHLENFRDVDFYTSPQSHRERGVEFSAIMDGMLSTTSDARKPLGIDARMIFGLQRHRSDADALSATKNVLLRKHKIVALGLDGPELGSPPAASRMHLPEPAHWHGRNGPCGRRRSHRIYHRSAWPVGR